MELWKICDGFDKELIPHFGNKYLIGNGYFGVRGTMEEYQKEQMCAVNMAGIYDRVGDAWRESVNAPNPFYTYVEVNGEKLALPENEPAEHVQELDFKKALHFRKTVWKTEKGNVSVVCERFASMANMHAAGMKYTVSADYDCAVKIVTGIDGDVWDINGPHFKEAVPGVSGDTEQVEGITGEKGIHVIVSEYVKPLFEAEINAETAEKAALKTISFNLSANKEYSFTKTAVITASCDITACADKADEFDYEEMKNSHISAWQKIWDISAVEIDGDDEAMHALNYSIYHLNCIAPRNLKGVSIPARGLSGQVYKGAVFWDTEMFMLDYYIHTEPEIAKNIIQYRVDTLQGAKNKAAEYNLDGAYYAWESQEGGYEACSDYNIVDVFTKRPMRTFFRDKQYHVSAAVVYGIMKYVNATADYAILSDGAMEVIIECAKMYRSLLLKKADGKYYEIHDVVGPDEYHERVNNNAYTNKMAQFVFKTAYDMIKKLDGEAYEKLSEKYDLAALSEMFYESAENMYIIKPDEETGIIEQFDGYLKREDTSVAEVRSRLLDHREYWGGAYGVAADTQVIKQADVIAMLSIFKKDYSKEIMKKNWEYYEPRTEHGSSLSACMYSLVACGINNANAAYPLFMKSASADLRTGGKEWMGLIYIGGTHPASEGGAWIVAVNGFAGISENDGELTAEPNLPDNWKAMRFKYLYRGKIYGIEISDNKAVIKEV